MTHIGGTTTRPVPRHLLMCTESRTARDGGTPTTGAAKRRATSATTTTPGEDVAAVVLALTLVAGVFTDGWAHVNRPGLDTFFSPWHAVLYGAAVLNFGWLAVLVWRRGGVMLSPRRALLALPAGYGLAAVGLVVFLLGGLVDMVWHTLLGVEVALDALLSPPHLMLFAGGMLALTSPVRAAAARLGPSPRPRQVWPAVLAVSAATALTSFFLL